MFKRISYILALQFTAFVFSLMLVNGLLFLAADYRNAHRLMNYRLDRAASSIVERMNTYGDNAVDVFIPPPLRGRVRIIDATGKVEYEGSLFANVPFAITAEQIPGYTSMKIDDEEYGLLTTRIMNEQGVAGYLQVAEAERFQRSDLSPRFLLYLIVSAIISVLTFLVGLFFARRSLKPAQQMVERLEQFTQDASHELRTPLAAMSSSLDLALKTGKHETGIVSAKEDLKEVSTLVERLLELARLDKLVLANEKVNMTSLVEQSIERYRLLAGDKQVTIGSSVAPNITAHGDGALIRQIVGNLLANAIKFSKAEGGKVEVILKKGLLEVKDEGIGIAKEDARHIFNRFYQADNSRSKDGYGLGLALVKRIVDLHGWNIDVQSKKGKGTVFTVRFGA